MSSFLNFGVVSIGLCDAVGGTLGARDMMSMTCGLRLPHVLMRSPLLISEVPHVLHFPLSHLWYPRILQTIFPNIFICSFLQHWYYGASAQWVRWRTHVDLFEVASVQCFANFAHVWIAGGEPHFLERRVVVAVFGHLVECAHDLSPCDERAPVLLGA
jgi:hypothetical protein